jgi:hypothetical protein
MRISEICEKICVNLRETTFIPRKNNLWEKSTRVKTYIITILSALIFSSIAKAQINESDTLKFQLRSTFTGNFQTGNVEMLTLRGRLDAAGQLSKDIVFKTQNSTLYQSFFGRKADNDVFSRNYLYYKPHNRLYPYAIAYVSSNFRRKVDIRYFAGAGLSCQLVQNTRSLVKLSANALYEQSNFSANTFNDAYYNGANQIKLWRASTYIMASTRVFNNRMRVYCDAFWQPAFQRSSNYRTQVDAGLEFPVWKGLTLNALFTHTHENVVPVSTKTTDTILTFGLGYGLKSKSK